MRRVALVLAAVLGCGCSSFGSSAVRTGPLVLPPHAGPVEVYAAGKAPDGAELGAIEVHATGSEGTVDQLLPLFVRRVAELGGNAAVLDAVSAHFLIMEHAHAETYTYPCGFYVCTGTRMYSVNDEVMVVSMRGRAMALGLSVRP